MAIREDGVRAVSVGELLDPARHNLQVPDYQRPYSWDPATALQLVDDITDACGEAAVHEPVDDTDDESEDTAKVGDDVERVDVMYVLGAVIFHRLEDRLDIVDGQQRLLTLRMILAIVDPQDNLVLPTTGLSPVSRVWVALIRRLGALGAEQRSDLSSFIRNRCQLVMVITDDVDEAFRVFDSQNFRGKPLAPHDLLKAHHLREMREESPAMKAAVVEGWESVNDEDLDRLFSTYLYRIARWTRGQNASGFTAHDIGIFKGISPKEALSPSSRYHVAAQATLSVLDVMVATNGLERRERERARFQLDAPVVAGRSFFEMVAFMLDELTRLAGEGLDLQVAQFSFYDVDNENRLLSRQSRSRYRYVCELYLAALLYYTNRFGDDELTVAKARLFAWAYAPRVALSRVQFRTIDNRGRGTAADPSAFTLMRNATSRRVVNQLATTAVPYADGHEESLVAVLSEEVNP